MNNTTLLAVVFICTYLIITMCSFSISIQAYLILGLIGLILIALLVWGIMKIVGKKALDDGRESEIDIIRESLKLQRDFYDETGITLSQKQAE